MKQEWVIAIKKQCRQSHIPFFFKQWDGVRKSRAGRLLDGRTYDEMPVRCKSFALSSSNNSGIHEPVNRDSLGAAD
jgi:hypothetical protein